MTKREFIDELRKKLSGLPAADVEERLSFYGEMIDDRMEEGLSEAAAVEAMGSVDDAAMRIISEAPALSVAAKEEAQGQTEWSTARSVLVIATAPIWFTLLLALFVVVFSLYIAAWAVVIALWVVELPLYIIEWVSKGLFVGCKYSTIGLQKLTYYGASALKHRFGRRA